MNRPITPKRFQSIQKRALIKEFRIFLYLVLAPVLFAFTLQGCAAPTRGDLLQKFAANPEIGAYIRDVPFYPQEKYMCGPAALTSLLNYYSFGYDIDEVTAEVFEEKIQGTLLMDMLIYAKLKGFNAKAYESGPFDLKEELKKKRPMILKLNLGTKEKPLGHYIVAIGFDDDTGTLIAHSGIIQAQIFPYKTIMKSWKLTGYSALLIRP
ncbi:MAG: C39 family peptidase [Proteobacteria bacterium]|nr:C39 family peptidase [Pseudomonadota bacterium]